MQRSDSSSGSPRLFRVVSTLQTILKAPMREAVLEALEQERQRARKEHESKGHGDVSDDRTAAPRSEPDERQHSGEGSHEGKQAGTQRGTGRRRKALALIVGLGVLSYLVRRRQAILESEPFRGRLDTGAEDELQTDEDLSPRHSETGAGAAVEDD